MADLKLKTVIGLSDRLTGPLRSLAGRVTATTARMSQAATRATLPLVAATGAATAATYKLVTSTAAANDELAKSSRRVGLTAQAYAELRHVSDLAGVGAEDFDKAMVRLNRTVGEAKARTGSFYTLLRKSDRTLLRQIRNTTNTAEAMDLVFEAMAKFEDPSRRAAFAAAAFGRAGQKMVLVTENGTEAIKDARSEFKRYFGELDEGALKRSEALVDTQARFNLALSGLKATIGNALIPVLDPLLQRLTAWTVANRDLVATRVTDFARRLVRTLESVPWGRVADGIGSVWRGLGRLVDMIGGVENVVPAVATLFGVGLVGSLVSLLGPIGLVGAAVVGMAAAWDTVGPLAKSALDTIRSAAPAAGRAVDLVLDKINRGLRLLPHLIELLQQRARLETFNDRKAYRTPGEMLREARRQVAAASGGRVFVGDNGQMSALAGVSMADVERQVDARFSALAASRREFFAATGQAAPERAIAQKAELAVKVILEGDGAKRATVGPASSKSGGWLKVGLRAVGLTP